MSHVDITAKPPSDGWCRENLMRKTIQNDTRVVVISIGIAGLFTLLIWALAGNLARFPHLPDQGPWWYFWKLSTKQFWPQFTAWSLYLLHQVTVWYLILRIQRSGAKPGHQLHRDNWWLLGVNLLFSGLHLLQTQVWYDGLAQDTPVMSSQGSVIVMLVLILIMENNRRGLFFGKTIKLHQPTVNGIRRYHGYYIAWAVIYTFWFHPMEGTSGHLVGFFYMFLLMIQMSVPYTRMHTNYIWTFILEIAVLFHGTVVAIMQHNGMWPMFFSGFGAMFIITQLYGLKLQKKWTMLATLLYVATVLAIYSGIFATDRTLAKLYEVIQIPVIEYGLVFVFVGILSLGFVGRRAAGWLRQATSRG